jgi:magnesium transporter
MLNVFSLANGRLFQEEIESYQALAAVQPVWVDLEAPTPEEMGWIAQHFGVTIPEDAVDDDLEESARFYEEDNGELHIRSDFLIGDTDTPRNVRVAFILFKGVLFSVHAEALPVFRLLRLRARRIPALIEDAKDVLLKLYDADAEYSADALEGIYDSLEAVSNRVLKQDVNDATAGEALSAIAREEDLNGRIRRNVMDTRRAVSFMMRSRLLNAEQFEEARQILRDIDSLDSHTTFLFDKINFPDECHCRLHQHQPEQDHQDLLRGQRRAAAADAHRKHLRHELQGDARTGLAVRVSVRAGGDDRLGGRSVRLFQAQGLAALTSALSARRRSASAPACRRRTARPGAITRSSWRMSPSSGGAAPGGCRTALGRGSGFDGMRSTVSSGASAYRP